VAADDHRADTQLPAYRLQRLSFQHPQAQDRGLVRRKALQQRFRRNAKTIGSGSHFAHRAGEGVQQRPFVEADCIEALMPRGVNAFLMLTARINSNRATLRASSSLIMSAKRR